MGVWWRWALVSSEEVAPSLTVCLPLLIFPCAIKSRGSLLAPAHPVGPRKRAVKRLCVCVCLDLGVCAVEYIVSNYQQFLSSFWGVTSSKRHQIVVETFVLLLSLSGVFWIVAKAWCHLWCWMFEFILAEQVWLYSRWSVKKWTVHCHSWWLVRFNTAVLLLAFQGFLFNCVFAQYFDTVGWVTWRASHT